MVDQLTDYSEVDQEPQTSHLQETAIYHDLDAKVEDEQSEVGSGIADDRTEHVSTDNGSRDDSSDDGFGDDKSENESILSMDASEQTDQSTDSNEQTDNELGKRRLQNSKKLVPKRMRRERNSMANNDVVTLLSSMKKIFKMHISKSSHPFDLLGASTMKEQIFLNLETIFFKKEFMEQSFSEDELSLVRAVLSTSSLDEVSRLLNQNLKLLLGIVTHVQENI